MKLLQHIFAPELIEAIGWTLVHSLWQGAIVAIAVTILLLIMMRNSAQLKYLVAFFSLILMLGWSSVTFVTSFNYAKEKTALKASIATNPGYIKNYLEQHLVAENIEGAEGEVVLNIRLVKIRSFFQRNFNLICTLWVIGLFLLIVRLIGGGLYARRLRIYHIVELGEEWMQKVDEFAQRLNIKRKVEAFFSPLANVPMTLGTLKPVILFPVAAFSGLSVKDIEAIIAHELAHVMRHDYFFNIIQKMVEMLFFYHPGIWIISAQIRAERENSCDNIAIALTGDKVAYAKALATVQLNQMEQGHLAMAFASQKGNILQRIKRLQKKVAMKTNFIEGLIAAGVIVIGLTLVSFTIGNTVHSQILPNDQTALVDQPNRTGQQAGTVAPKERSKQEVDSIRQSMEKNLSKAEEAQKVSDKLEKVVEVALSEQDEELSAEMMEEINKALGELDIEGIVNEALHEAQKAIKEVDMKQVMKEAREDIDYEEIRHDMEEARRDIEEAKREMRKEMREDMEADGDVPEEIINMSIEAAEAGLDVASAVLENLNIGGIIDAALSGVEGAFEAIGEIDFEQLQKNDSISEEDIVRLKKKLEMKEEQLKKEKEKLKQKEKELKKKTK